MEETSENFKWGEVMERVPVKGEFAYAKENYQSTFDGKPLLKKGKAYEVLESTELTPGKFSILMQCEPGEMSFSMDNEVFHRNFELRPDIAQLKDYQEKLSKELRDMPDAFEQQGKYFLLNRKNQAAVEINSKIHDLHRVISFMEKIEKGQKKFNEPSLNVKPGDHVVAWDYDEKVIGVLVGTRSDGLYVIELPDLSITTRINAQTLAPTVMTKAEAEKKLSEIEGKPVIIREEKVIDGKVQVDFEQFGMV